jgi:ribosomal-protein-alanine N-acetyltransferase
MARQPRFTLRSASIDDQQKLAHLIHFNARVHRHLDYRPPLDWIGNGPFLILEHHREIVAALCCPPDPPGVAWIRIFVSATSILYQKAWKELWQEVHKLLIQVEDLETVAAIPLNNWFESLLKKHKFKPTQRIQMLKCDQYPGSSQEHLSGVAIRPMNLDDLTRVREIDKRSFTPVWQNSLSCLEYAFRQSTIATVVEYKGQLAGYQISTPTQMGGHLARLAILPDIQGKGIGYALLLDLLRQFKRRGALAVTVNTQKDNQASLSLYKKAGFKPSGGEYPIYQFKI